MTLFIRGYYSIFNSIALMYGKISKQWIMPGMAQVLELSKQTDDQDRLEKKRQSLNAFTTDAQEAIHTEVSLVSHFQYNTSARLIRIFSRLNGRCFQAWNSVLEILPMRQSCFLLHHQPSRRLLSRGPTSSPMRQRRVLRRTSHLVLLQW
jgi:hypothetical protein